MRVAVGKQGRNVGVPLHARNGPHGLGRPMHEMPLADVHRKEIYFADGRVALRERENIGVMRVPRDDSLHYRV